VTQKNRTNRTNYANHSNYSNYTPHPGYAMKGSVANMAGAGALRVPGAVRDAGRYGDRLRENKKYPNRRRRIITGKELTTPLTRKKAQKARAKATPKETVSIEVQTVAVKTKKFPLSALFGLILLVAVLAGLIATYIALNEQNSEINLWKGAIDAEDRKEKNLTNEFENKHDFNALTEYAISELGMVKEESASIRKTYISGRSGDRAEVVEAKGGLLVGLHDVMTTVFRTEEKGK